MLSPFAPVIMPLLMTENGLEKANEQSDGDKEDSKVKSFRNTFAKSNNDVTFHLKKRPLSDTASEYSQHLDDVS